MTDRPEAATFQGTPLTLTGDEVEVGQTSPDFTLLEGLDHYTLSDGKGTVRIFNVVVSLDTPVCDTQSRRFAEEAAGLPGVEILTISADLPFAQARWAKQAGAEGTQRLLSDHRDLSFGQAYGLAIKELRLLARALIVLDADDTIIHMQRNPELTREPDYDAALAAARQAAAG